MKAIKCEFFAKKLSEAYDRTLSSQSTAENLSWARRRTINLHQTVDLTSLGTQSVQDSLESAQLDVVECYWTDLEQQATLIYEYVF